jgi:flagellar biogenesis protein FliO
MGKVPAALGAVVVLILALRFMGKKVLPGAGASRGSGAMQLVARTAVGPKHQVMLIQVGRRLVMVGSAGGEMSRLCEITDADEVAELLATTKGSSAGASFKAMIGGAGRAYERDEQKDEADESAGNGGSSELAGLMDRVRQMSEKFQGT